jgi:hypothetical protein
MMVKGQLLPLCKRTQKLPGCILSSLCILPISLLATLGGTQFYSTHLQMRKTDVKQLAQGQVKLQLFKSKSELLATGEGCLFPVSSTLPSPITHGSLSQTQIALSNSLSSYPLSVESPTSTEPQVPRYLKSNLLDLVHHPPSEHNSPPQVHSSGLIQKHWGLQQSLTQPLLGT